MTEPVIPQRFERAAQFALIAALLIGCWLVLQPFLAALLFAGVVAVSTWPAFVWLRARLGGRAGLAAGLACLLVLLAIVLPVAMVFVSAADGLHWLVGLIRSRLESGPILPPDWVREIPFAGAQLEAYWLKLAFSRDEVVALGRRVLDPARGLGLQAVAALGSGLLQLALAVFVLFFLYRDGARLASLLREGGERLFGGMGNELTQTAHNTVVGVMVGMVGTAVAQALVAVFGFWIAGVPAPLLLASLVFLLSMVPVGPPLIWGGAALWLYQQGEPGWAVFMAVYGALGISSVDNFVKPILIARTSSLPLVVAVLGVFGGVLAFGVIGLFVGPTLLALALALGRRWIEMRVGLAGA